ncbi:iron chaperone [Nocardia sp. NPDC059240]|uniref:iron chaperone n=1 Tax=Nocardia sp. NPDC059240 TaxID=3346786 RepID=UPI0036AF21E5
MPRSTASTVEEYLAGLPEDRRPALTSLRELCRAHLTGFREVMNYGMPTYERGNGAEIAFASQKQYISFYLMRPDLRDTFADRLAGHDMGKGCLRFRKPDAIDFALLADILTATADSPGDPC